MSVLQKMQTAEEALSWSVLQLFWFFQHKKTKRSDAALEVT